MRTTLTIDDDVAALLHQVQKKSKSSLKEVINTALRSGLIGMVTPSEVRPPFATKTLITGPRLLPNIDDVSEVLAIIEGEDHK